MGRTVTPFSIALSREETRLKKFGRALRVEDERRFDELFERPAKHSGCRDGHRAGADRMLVGTHKEIEKLKSRPHEDQN